jgi:hypothetical protein
MEGLLKDIVIYASGLLPFFESAASSVRMEFLDIVARFFLPLGEQIRVMLSSLVLALLPGLEEEHNEAFNRTFHCLSAIGKIVTPTVLMRCLWKSMIVGSRHRIAVCHYISQMFPKNSREAQDSFSLLADNRALIAEALSSGLGDSSALVIRSILDLICCHFPLLGDSFSDELKVSLCQAVLLVLLRRDMSLSRRVFQWILQPACNAIDGDKEEHDLPERPSSEAAFMVYRALKEMMRESTRRFEERGGTQTFRIVLHSLLVPKSTFMQLVEALDLRLLWMSVADHASSIDALQNAELLTVLCSVVEDIPALLDDEQGSVYVLLFLSVALEKSQDKTNTGAIHLIPPAILLFLASLHDIDHHYLQTVRLSDAPAKFLEEPVRVIFANASALNVVDMIFFILERIFTDCCNLLRYKEVTHDVLNALHTMIDGLARKFLPSPRLSDIVRRSGFLTSSYEFVRDAGQSPELTTLLCRILLNLPKLTSPEDHQLTNYLPPVLDTVLCCIWNNLEKPSVLPLLHNLQSYFSNEIDSFCCRHLSNGEIQERVIAISKFGRIWSCASTTSNLRLRHLILSCSGSIFGRK